MTSAKATQRLLFLSIFSTFISLEACQKSTISSLNPNTTPVVTSPTKSECATTSQDSRDSKEDQKLSDPETACTEQANLRLRFASYNVENLHDNLHDESKDDYAFLPKDYPGKDEACKKIENPGYRKDCETGDWTPDKLEIKLNQIKRVVGEFNSEMNSELPHFIGLVEIENANVVGMLAQKLGYNSFAVSESPDERGMDVGLLFQEKDGVKFLSKEEHVVPGPKATRNILQVNFELACGRRLSIFVNHWPSQAAPASSRIFAAQTLRAAIEKLIKDDPTAMAVAVGDFNVTLRDRPDPLFQEFQSNDWAALFDLESIARPAIAKKDPKRAQTMAFGTYFYPTTMEWNQFDRAFMTQNLTNQSGLEVDPLSYRIINSDFMTKSWTYKDNSPIPGSIVTKIPLKYNFLATTAELAGFADHFPIYFELQESVIK